MSKRPRTQKYQSEIPSHQTLRSPSSHLDPEVMSPQLFEAIVKGINILDLANFLITSKKIYVSCPNNNNDLERVPKYKIFQALCAIQARRFTQPLQNNASTS